MRLFTKQEGNEVPGKTKIYKTIEKYRKPGQTHKAKAIAWVLPDSEKTGMIGVEIVSFDGVSWFIAARLRDIYELHQENKIEVINMNVTRNEVIVINNGLSFIFLKNTIPTPNIKSIPRKYAEDTVNYVRNNSTC